MNFLYHDCNYNRLFFIKQEICQIHFSIKIRCRLPSASSTVNVYARPSPQAIYSFPITIHASLNKTFLHCIFFLNCYTGSDETAEIYPFIFNILYTANIWQYRRAVTGTSHKHYYRKIRQQDIYSVRTHWHKNTGQKASSGQII